jgi:hypothetical protein
MGSPPRVPAGVSVRANDAVAASPFGLARLIRCGGEPLAGRPRRKSKSGQRPAGRPSTGYPRWPRSAPPKSQPPSRRDGAAFPEDSGARPGPPEKFSAAGRGGLFDSTAGNAKIRCSQVKQPRNRDGFGRPTGDFFLRHRSAFPRSESRKRGTIRRTVAGGSCAPGMDCK